MSHKSTIKLKINDRQALIDALKIMGVSYTEAQTENGLKTQCEYRNTISDVDIRLEKSHNGSNMRSVGFRKEKDGSYTAVGDFWVLRGAKTKDGEALNESQFKKAVSKRYAYAKALQELQAAGFVGDQATDQIDFSQTKVVTSFTSMA